MPGINNKNKGSALLAVIAFVILTAIIAEAFLVYFYNQYRLTLQKIIYEKTFYFALSGIEWAKVLIKTQDSRLDASGDTVQINSWAGNSPEINLLYAHQADEYPDLPYEFLLIIKRLGNRIISYCESEISSGGKEKVFAARRIEVTLQNPNPPLPDVTETSWQEITPADKLDL
jgi:hypothetical protein